MRNKPAREVGDPETRRLMIEGATRVFNERLFNDVTVDDITGLVQCARGTFYIYFKNKLDAFEKVVEAVVQEFIDAMEAVDSSGVLPKMIARNRLYLDIFGKYAGIMRNFYFVAAFSPKVAALHASFSGRAAARMRRYVEKHMRGSGSNRLNKDLVAVAFGHLVEATAYWWLAASPRLPDNRNLSQDEVAATLSSLIYRAIHLEDAPARSEDGESIPSTAGADGNSSKISR